MEEIFLFAGQEYSLAEVQAAADAKSLSIEDYTKKYNVSRKVGKITPPKEDNQGGPVEVNVTPSFENLQTQINTITDTESPSEDILSDLPKAENIGFGQYAGMASSTIEKEPEEKKSNKEIQQEALRKSISSITGIPEMLVPSTAAVTSGVLDTAAGIGDFFEKYGYAPLAAIVKTGGLGTTNPGATLLEYEKIAKENNLDLSEITNAADLIDNLSVKKFDEQGNEKDIFGLIEEGNYSDAAELAVNQALGSAPSLALSIASPVYGSALLGMSTAGGEFERELKERPEESISKIAGGSLLKGGIEFGSEFLGGKATRILGRLDKTGVSEKVIKDFTSNFLEKSLKTTAAALGGSITEGLTEGVTALGQTFVDDKLYEDEIEANAYFRNAVNGAIVGAIMGGPVAGTSRGISFTNINKNKAYEFIAPKKWRNEKINIDLNIIEAKLNLKAAPSNKKKKFQEQINVLELQKENRTKELNNAFDGLTKKELLKYTNNISIIDDALGEINNGKYTAAQQKLAEQQLKNAAKENELLVTPEFFDAEIEESISKALKNKEVLFERGEKIKGVKPKELDIIEITPDQAEQITEKKEAKFTDGFFLEKAKSKDGRAKLYIIPDVAAKTGATNVYAHEMLHYIISKNFKTDNESMRPLIDSFKKYLSELKVKDQKQGYILDRVQKRIDDNYTEKGKIEEGALEEYMNIFSDLIANEKIVIEESLTSKLKNTFKQYFNGLGFGNVKLDTGKDLFNFLRNYTKNVNSKNKLIKFGFIDPKVISEKLPKADELDSIIKKSRSQKASDEVQRIYEEQGTGGAMDIIDQFKPIVDKLVNKYRDVPGFEYELLKDEIETGKRGILDMIMEYTPEKAKGAPLAGYINTFLSRRAIEAANRILKTDFELDVTEAKGVTDTVTAEETIEREEATPADEIKSLRKEIGLSEELVTTVKDAVIKTFGTKLPNPQDPKFRLELQKRFRTELKKPMAKFVGKQADYESFLRDNFKAIYDKLPQSLINRRFKDFAEPVLDENGKQLRERTAEGNKIFTKKKITPAEFIKYFLGSDVGRSTQGTRKTAIVEAVAEEIAFDATMEVINDADISLKYEQISELTGEILPDNYLAQIAKQIDRNEDFKFSKSILNDSGLSNQELSNILFKGFISASGKIDPKIIEVLLDDAWAKRFPSVLEDFIFPGYKEALKNKTIKEQADLTKYLINIISRPLRTASYASKKLEYNTNTRLFRKLEKIAGPELFGKFGSDSLIQLEQIQTQDKNGNWLTRSYIRDKNGVALGSSTYNTSTQTFHKDLINNKLSRKEVDGVFSENRRRLKEIIFTLGEKNPGLALSLIKLTQKDQRGLLRSSGRIGVIVQNYTGDTVFEHRPPVQYLYEQIADYLQNPSKNKKEALNVLLDTAQINVVPKDFANIVDQEYKTTMPTDGSLSYEKALKETNYQFDGDLKFSKTLSRDFNEKILQATTDIKWFEKFSPVEARIMGKGKGRKFFIPYSADDFVGLLYTTLGKGKVGDKQMQWYQDNLLRPFSRGIQQYEAAKQNALREWQLIKKEAKKDVPGGLNKKNATGLTNQDAVRIFIWNEQGMEIPGTSNKLINDNLEVVKNNPKLQEFAERLMALNPEGYPEPSKNWDSGDITTDIVSYINDVKRSEFLTEFKENAEEIFSDENKQKLRALYGDNYIEALDDILFRMTTGTNRRKGASKVEQQFMNWTNNSVGAIMFFNARSAVLQTLSAVNFINFSDNNPINAAIAFGKQKQYWNDFSTLFNSDFLKQRRTGLQTDVNADEIARAAKGSKNTARAALSALLKFGFTPTQIADSFAIASGGATFYRNRIKTYLKEGLTQEEAETKAFTDFQEIAEETQQSARPDRISLQQASSLGRLVLAFANTPMQYARLTKKATLDLINGRGDWKTNVSKIAYYSVIQNIIFSALQQGLFALLFNDEDDDKEKSRLFRIGNSSVDTLLRGIGVYGAAAATVKNMILEIIEQSEKSRPDYTKLAIEATSISPPINSKLRKLESAGKTFTYKQSKEKVFTEGFSLENPALLAGGKVLSAATNLPADRVVQKADHIYTAMQPETELWQAIALSLGWSEWDLGMIKNQTKKSKKPKISLQRKLKTKRSLKRKLK